MGVFDLFSLKGKVAVITGARRGIGAAIAIMFAEAGADVSVSDVIADSGELDSVAGKIRKFGKRALALKCDVTKKAEVDDMVRKTIDTLGQIDILVNNAGTIDPTKPGSSGPSLLTLNQADWNHALDLNLMGCYLCCQAVGKHMIERKTGNIININSAESLKAIQDYSNAYAVAKSGMRMVTRGLAHELAKHNIRVNEIAPHAIGSELIMQLFMHDPKNKEIIAQTPRGRLGECEEIASAALFLASDASSWVSGHTLLVDGGLMA